MRTACALQQQLLAELILLYMGSCWVPLHHSESNPVAVQGCARPLRLLGHQHA